jgi:DNA-binding XRE family transcriptional regulator
MSKNYINLEFHIRIRDVFYNYLGYKKQSEIVEKYKNIKTASLNKYFNTQKTITRKLINLLYEENVNIDWICTGRGEPLIDKRITENNMYNPNIEIYTRIAEAFNNKRIGQTKLSEIYSLSKALINNYFNVNTTITADLARICFHENINIDWICTGRGSMFINDLSILDNNEKFVDNLIEKNKARSGDSDNSIEEKTLQLLKQLTRAQKEYYFHKISADFLENNLKK